jgi:hypothetical protein
VNQDIIAMGGAWGEIAMTGIEGTLDGDGRLAAQAAGEADKWPRKIRTTRNGFF